MNMSAKFHDSRSFDAGRLTHHVWKAVHGVVRHELHHRIEFRRISEGHIREATGHPIESEGGAVHSLPYAVAAGRRVRVHGL